MENKELIRCETEIYVDLDEVVDAVRFELEEEDAGKYYDLTDVVLVTANEWCDKDMYIYNVDINSLENLADYVREHIDQELLNKLEENIEE